MPALSSFLSSTVEKLLFRPVRVLESEVVGGRFRLVRVQGEVFAGVSWTPGQAVQFYVGNFTKRSYTPMDVDAGAGSARFLFHLHGGGPAAKWAETLEVGDLCQVMRPKDSLDFKAIGGDAIFFGDDTSFAAAHALQSCSQNAIDGSSGGRRYVIEVCDMDAAKMVARKLGLEKAILIQQKRDDAHLAAVLERLAEGATELQLPQWVFTGKARSIQTLQKSLKEKGIATGRSQVRAYWSPGKTGME
jgi:NADPH-dependent ferric siderophore reductase